MTVTLDPGRLTTKVTIERLANDRDEHKAPTAPSWSPVASVWAELVPQSSREFQAAAARQAALTHLVRIHYRTGLTARHRLRLGSRILNLLGPPRDTENAHVELVFECAETDQP